MKLYRDFIIVDDKVVEILTGNLKGLKYSYTEAYFDGDEDPLLHYSYDLVEGEIADMDEFTDVSGAIIIELLRMAVIKEQELEDTEFIEE